MEEIEDAALAKFGLCGHVDINSQLCITLTGGPVMTLSGGGECKVWKIHFGFGLDVSP